MTLASPGWLLLGGLVVLGLAIAAVVAGRQRRQALAAAGLHTANPRRAVGLWFCIAGLALLAIGAGGPAASVPVTRAAGTVIVAIDVSNSMSATDVAPTRLDAARAAAKSFVEAQPGSVDIGVVAFQFGALTTSLPSADHAAAAQAIDRLRTDGSTSIAAAILTSLSAITGKSVSLKRDGGPPDIGYWPSASIIVFSDGEDEVNAAVTEAAAETAQRAGVHIETVGVGTAEGATIEVDGFRLHTALDETGLAAVAKTSGGSYRAASRVAELADIAKSIDLRLSTHHENEPLAGAFVAAAVVLLAFGGMATVWRSGRLV